MKKILLIGEISTKKYYLEFAKKIKRKDFDIDIIFYTWKRKKYSDWVNQIMGVKKKYDVVIGFSVGGTILLSVRPLGAKTFLCSPSPLFSLKMFNEKEKKILGKRRIKDLQTYSKSRFRNRNDIYVFSGENEISVMKKYARALSRPSRFILVPDCGHNLNCSNYVDLLAKNIGVI